RRASIRRLLADPVARRVASRWSRTRSVSAPTACDDPCGAKGSPTFHACFVLRRRDLGTDPARSAVLANARRPNVEVLATVGAQRALPGLQRRRGGSARASG